MVDKTIFFCRISAEQELNFLRKETNLFSSTSMAEKQQFRIPAKQNFLPLKATRFTKKTAKEGEAVYKIGRYVTLPW